MTSPAAGAARGTLRGQALRFLVVGAANTLITYAIFIGLGLVVAPWIAFTIAFALGLVWTAFGSSRFVFRARHSTRRMLVFIGWYLLLYGIGQLVIRLISPDGLVELLITSAAVLVVTTPLTFIGGRYVFGRAPRPLPEEEEILES
jgi:putative flippase GtrA